jgi:hypothetical protein
MINSKAYYDGSFEGVCDKPKCLANNATRPRVHDKRNASIPNIVNATVVHIPILKCKVVCLGEYHLPYADDALFVAYMCTRLVEAVPQVDVFIEDNQNIELDESYLQGGRAYEIMCTINDEFAKLSMTSKYIRLHKFDTRYYSLSNHVPDEAHHLLSESRMPDKRATLDMFMHPSRQPDTTGIADADADLDHQYVSLYGASLLAGINARIMQAFGKINLPQSIKHKLRLEKLRTLFSGLEHMQVFMTDYLLFYDWLVTATNPDYNNQTRFSIVYAGDAHVRNMQHMFSYLATCCHSHVVEKQILATNLAFCVSDVDQLVGEWQRESHPDFV